MCTKKNVMKNLIGVVVVILIVCLPFNLQSQNKDGSIHIPDTLHAASMQTVNDNLWLFQMAPKNKN